MLCYRNYIIMFWLEILMYGVIEFDDDISAAALQVN
jgi:hypothetical protein